MHIKCNICTIITKPRKGDQTCRVCKKVLIKNTRVQEWVTTMVMARVRVKVKVRARTMVMRRARMRMRRRMAISRMR